MLDKYIGKRRFGETPEPKGKQKKLSSQVLHFVIQKHQASRLHYDFRLELNGVLLSWAIPKGPSLDPEDKRLAIKVEDHPFEYKDFEGIIPAGNYGAGTVMIWDEGTYQPLAGDTISEQEKIIEEGIKNGHLTFLLDGIKLNGEFALIRLKNSKEDNAWLLIKAAKDNFAASYDILILDKSARSDRSLNQIREEALSDGSFWTSNTEDILIGAPAQDIISPVEPMMAKLVSDPFDDDEWYFEIKWDGYRAITEINRDVHIYSRNHKSFNDRFPTIVNALKSYRKEAIFDGEIVALDDKGRSRFELLQGYFENPTDKNIYYLVFDVLHYEGRDLTGLPLSERKAILKKIIPKVPNIRYSEEIIGEGTRFYQAAKDNDLEGIMAKKISSKYQPGKRGVDWLKIKVHKQQEVVIGGFTHPKGSRMGLGSLLMGVYKEDKLCYIGNVGTGFDNDTLVKLLGSLENNQRESSPFSNPPKSKNVTWIDPVFVAEVKFQEWTSAGSMRQPVFLGLREDKSPREVIKEVENGEKR